MRGRACPIARKYSRIIGRTAPWNARREAIEWAGFKANIGQLEREPAHLHAMDALR